MRGEAGERGGGGVYGVDVMPYGWRAHATVGGEDPWDEEAVSGGGSGGVFGVLFGGAGGEDGVRIGDGGWEVGWEEWAADCEVDGYGLLGEGGGEEEVDSGAGGEGGVEVGDEGGFEGGFLGEVDGGAAGELT